MKSKKPKEKPELFVPAKPENPDTPRIYKEGQPPSFFYRDNEGLYAYRSEYARSSAKLKCPWCETENRVFIWSLAGGGKRCEGCKSLMGFRHTIVSPEAYEKFKAIQTEKLAQEAAERFPETFKQLEQ